MYMDAELYREWRIAKKMAALQTADERQEEMDSSLAAGQMNYKMLLQLHRRYL